MALVHFAAAGDDLKRTGMSSTVDKLRLNLGVIFYSDWLLIDQAMIDRFASATLDHQYIHVDHPLFGVEERRPLSVRCVDGIPFAAISRTAMR